MSSSQATQPYVISTLKQTPKIYSLLVKDIWNSVLHREFGSTEDLNDQQVTLGFKVTPFIKDMITRYRILNMQITGSDIIDVLNTIGFDFVDSVNSDIMEADSVIFSSYSLYKSDSDDDSLKILYNAICKMLSVPTQDAEEAKHTKPVKVHQVDDVASSYKSSRTSIEMIGQQCGTVANKYKVAELIDGKDVLLFNISDMHFFNKIQARDALGLNEYNESIARARWATFIQGAIDLIEVKRPKYVILAMLGDFYSGRVHNNYDKDMDDSTMTEIIMKGESMIADMISRIAEKAYIKTIHVCPGNHSRINVKDFDITTFLRDNDDYATGCRMKQLFADKLPTTLINSPGSLTIADCIEGVGYIFSHGMTIRGGSGMSGMPVHSAVLTTSRWASSWQDVMTKARQGELDIRMFNPNLANAHDFYFKYAIIGHFHSTMHIPGPTVTTLGGLSLLGTCKFAKNILGFNSPAGVTYYRLNSRGVVEEGSILV